MNLDAVDFLTKHQVGVIATCTEGKPHAVPVYYHYHQEDGCVYFVTKADTQKYQNINNNDNVFFSVFTTSPQASFRAECKAMTNLEDKGSNADIINILVGVHAIQVYQPTPIEPVKRSEMKLVKLEIQNYQFDEYNKEIVSE